MVIPRYFCVTGRIWRCAANCAGPATRRTPLPTPLPFLRHACAVCRTPPHRPRLFFPVPPTATTFSRYAAACLLPVTACHYASGIPSLGGGERRASTRTARLRATPATSFPTLPFLYSSEAERRKYVRMATLSEREGRREEEASLMAL